MFEDPLFFLQDSLARKINTEKKRRIQEVMDSCYFFAQFNLGILYVYNDHRNDIISRENNRKSEQNNICLYSLILHINKYVFFSLIFAINISYLRKNFFGE